MPRKRKEPSSGSPKSLAERIGKISGGLLEPLPREQRRPEILLQSNIPKPLHGVAPRVVLGATWWNRERRLCYQSTNFRCLACGVSKYSALFHQWMEAHELYEIDYQKGRATYTGTAPLCHLCHNAIHDGRLKALLDQGKIHHAKYVAVIQHRDRVLLDAGLPPKPSLDVRIEEEKDRIVAGKMAQWSEWRMIVNGVEYPPMYKTFEEWKAYHDGIALWKD